MAAQAALLRPQVVLTMVNPIIHLLVTDLDNTLYDWVTFFAHAFYDMISVASKVLDVPEERLLDECRAVHQRYHNSEHPFALLETQTVLRRYPALARSERALILDDAFHEFNRTRSRTLRLYPGVEYALRAIQQIGVPVVAHTEASVPNAVFRLRSLRVDTFFDYLYAAAPEGLGHPDADRQEEQPHNSLPVEYLGRGERKPDPQILEGICQRIGVSPGATLYVGDSISRDIGMAKAAGAWAAWAQYGTKFDAALWQRIVRITHWRQEDVERAKAADDHFGNSRADATLHDSFAEILEHFSFESFNCDD